MVRCFNAFSLLFRPTDTANVLDFFYTTSEPTLNSEGTEGQKPRMGNVEKMFQKIGRHFFSFTKPSHL